MTNYTIRIKPRKNLNGPASSDKTALDNAKKLLDTSALTNRNLLIAFYVLLITGLALCLSITDEQLLIGNIAILLPFLNLSLPISTFASLLPLLLLVAHFDLLHNLNEHSRKLRAWVHASEGVRQPVGRTGAVASVAGSALSDQLFPFVYDFAWLHASGKGQQNINAKLLPGLSWALYCWAPFSVLIIFLIRFADLQEYGYTGWHLLLVLLDGAWLYWYWPRFPAHHAGRHWSYRFLHKALSLPMLLLPLSIMAGGWTLWLFGLIQWCLDFHGQPDRVEQMIMLEQTLGQYSSMKLVPRLTLPNFEVKLAPNHFAMAKLAQPGKSEAELWPDTAPSVNLADRRLGFADFTGAVMPRANFARAKLVQARMTRARLVRAYLGGAQLRGVNLEEATLHWAKLIDANLEGGNLGKAQLQLADLTKARLPMANLNSAQMQGTKFVEAYLPGAFLHETQLQGADLTHTDMRGADLMAAGLQGAAFVATDLRGTRLDRAQLQGAKISANLAGSTLHGAALFGAVLFGNNAYGSHGFRGDDGHVPGTYGNPSSANDAMPLFSTPWAKGLPQADSGTFYAQIVAADHRIKTSTAGSTTITKPGTRQAGHEACHIIALAEKYQQLGMAPEASITAASDYLRQINRRNMRKEIVVESRHFTHRAPSQSHRQKCEEAHLWGSVSFAGKQVPQTTKDRDVDDFLEGWLAIVCSEPNVAQAMLKRELPALVVASRLRTQVNKYRECAPYKNLAERAIYISNYPERGI